MSYSKKTKEKMIKVEELEKKYLDKIAILIKETNLKTRLQDKIRQIATINFGGASPFSVGTERMAYDLINSKGI